MRIKAKSAGGISKYEVHDTPYVSKLVRDTKYGKCGDTFFIYKLKHSNHEIIVISTPTNIYQNNSTMFGAIENFILEEIKI